MNALCNLSRKKSREVAASLPGRFLSRRCFTLCITMEVEPRNAKRYKCHHCCSCKNYRGKGIKGGKNGFASFLAGYKIAISWGEKAFWASCSTSNKLLLVARHTLTTGLKNFFKAGSVKFASSLSPPSIVKKVRTGSKISQGRKSRELTTPPEPPNSGPCEALSVYLESRSAGTGACSACCGCGGRCRSDSPCHSGCT